MSVGTRSDLVTGVEDVRHLPLAQLSREVGSADGPKRVLPDAAVHRVALSAFSSSL